MAGRKCLNGTRHLWCADKDPAPHIVLDTQDTQTLYIGRPLAAYTKTSSPNHLPATLITTFSSTPNPHQQWLALVPTVTPLAPPGEYTYAALATRLGPSQSSIEPLTDHTFTLFPSSPLSSSSQRLWCQHLQLLSRLLHLRWMPQWLQGRDQGHRLLLWRVSRTNALE